jgi:hypothetical protein
MDQPCCRTAHGQGFAQSGKSQLAMQPVAGCPTNDPSCEQVDNDGEVEPAFAGPDIGEILSANSGGVRQSSETRHARPGTRAPGQPMHGARDVYCGGRAGLLQSALGQADVAASSHAEGAHAL